jgi:hypothetical protein
MQRGAHDMQYFASRFSSLLILAWIALLLMGADGQVKSNGTVSIISSVSSSLTNSPLSSSTDSITSRTTNNLSSSATRSTAPVVSRPTATSDPLSCSRRTCKDSQVDRRVLIIAKGESQDHIGRLIGFDEENYQISPRIVISVPEDKTDHILSSLRKKLLPLKYMPFVVEMNEGLKIDKIGIIKGTDQFEILRIMHTAGSEYDISNQDVIDRLKEWEVNSPFDILGADSDWVEIEFRILPKDLTAFAEEVNDFCPDAVDEGQGIADLAKEIQKTKKLFLLWD